MPSLRFGTLGTEVRWYTAMEHPVTIHDFGGFPKELYDVIIPGARSLALAKQTQELVKKDRGETG